MRSFLTAALCCLAWAAHAQVPAAPARGIGDTLVANDAGETLYIVYLQEERARREHPGNEPAARAAADPANRADVYGWHRANVRALVKRLERTYGVKAVSMTSWAMPTFAAFMPEDVVARVRQDPAVSAVQASYRSHDYSAWANRQDGAETVPWGKIAIGTDDAASTGNTVYVIDGWMQTHPDLTFTYGTVNANYGGGADHATHVGGIVAALMNNAGTRGVDPGAPMWAVLRGDADNEVQSAIDWVLGHAEQQGIYAVANLSSSAPRYSSTGVIAPFIRRASTRVLFVQAAGNQKSHACLYAYGPPNPQDGILVVGGIDENGQQAVPYDNTATPPYGIEDGSNYGSCVEVWAPSTRIFSTWVFNNYANLSGTSMAAPHVAALAARYGNNATTPVEREEYIRSRLFHTGGYDINWNPIRVPSFTQPPAYAVPSRLPVYSITASAFQQDAYAVNDGLYLGPVWNAGSGPPAWIEFDLGYSRPLRSIRLTPEQSPSGAATHQVYAGDTSPPANLVATISGDRASLEPVAASLSGNARFVRVHTQSVNSWVAWREIEIYGY